MLDSANSQGPGGAAVIHSALSPVTAEFEVLWRPPGYALITGQKKICVGRKKFCLGSLFGRVSLPLSFTACIFQCPLLNIQFSAMHGKSMRYCVIQKNTAPAAVDIDDYQLGWVQQII